MQHTRSNLQTNVLKIGETGFTLIELMITIAILVIITLAAIPSIRSVMANNKGETLALQFVDLLRFARSEAIKSNTGVLVCFSQIYAPLPGCNAPGIAGGSTGLLASYWTTGATIKVLPFMHANSAWDPSIILGTSQPSFNQIYFNPTGIASAPPGGSQTFPATICFKQPGCSRGYEVQLSTSGIVSLTTMDCTSMTTCP